jgi:hypothetical protein
MGPAKTPGPQPRRRTPLLLFVIGGGLLVGVATAIALAPGGPNPPEPAISDAKIVAMTPPADAADLEPADAAAAPPPTPVAVDAAEPAADDLEAECQAFETDRKWGELEQCADKLKPLSPQRAAELKTRAAKEAKTAPRVAAVEEALRDRNLKRARAELEQVWTESVEYPALKRKLELAEDQAITDLALDLARVKDSGCEEYKSFLTKQRPLHPARVTAEAARRIPCVPAAKCDASALAERGRAQFAAGQLAPSLASYEAAYACKSSPNWSEKAFIIACNLQNLPRSKLHWKRLPLSMKTRALGVCVRNGITEAKLNAP